MSRPTRWITYTLQTGLALFFAFSATTKLTGGMDDVRDVLAGDALADMLPVFALLALLLIVTGLQWRDAHIGDLLAAGSRRSVTAQSVAR